MVDPDLIFGRLGNRMFQMAALLTFSEELKHDIYFQNEVWFYKHRDKIKELFRQGVPERINKTSIHVRRGDYISQHSDFYVNLMDETRYYQKAIEMFPRSTQFLVFSDDIRFCKDHPLFMFHNFEFSEGKSEIEDMNLMAACENNIGANSSFSWWAAYLNNNPNRKVIFPKVWDKKNRNFCTPCSEWTLI